MLTATGTALLSRCSQTFAQPIRGYRRQFLDRQYASIGIPKVMKSFSMDRRLLCEGGRRMLMRKILKDKFFLAYGHKQKNNDQRLNYPL